MGRNYKVPWSCVLLGLVEFYIIWLLLQEMEHRRAWLALLLCLCGFKKVFLLLQEIPIYGPAYDFFHLCCHPLSYCLPSSRVLLPHSLHSFHRSWNNSDPKPKKIKVNLNKLNILALNVHWFCFDVQFLFGVVIRQGSDHRWVHDWEVPSNACICTSDPLPRQLILIYTD